jgi:fibronectin-binding autotransporter adhesin
MDSDRKPAHAVLLSKDRAGNAAPRLWRAVATLSASLFFTPAFFSARAKGATIRADVSDSLYTGLSANAQYASPSGVVYVNLGAVGSGNNILVGSGTLIAPDWVLTAAHVVTQNTGSFPTFAPSSITFGQGASQAFPAGDTAQSVAVESGWAYVAQEGNDLALVQLSAPVTTAVPTTLYTSGLGTEIGQTATIIGYGNTGNGINGAVANTYGTRRAVQNVVDAFGGQTTTNGSGQQVPFTAFSSNLMLTDFDSPTDPTKSLMGSTTPLPLEGASIGGDSGGGLFFTVGGAAYLAGVTSLVGYPGTGLYGTYNGYTRLSVGESTSFITSTLAVPATWQSASGGSWTGNGNWASGTSPQFAGATANFLGAISGNQTITLDDPSYPWIMGIINFNNPTSSYTLAQGSGGSIVLQAGSASASAAINDLGGTHYILAPVNLTSNAVVTITNPSDELHLAGVISGPRSLTLSGGGSLSLESTNTYAGATAVNSGTLLVAAATGLPTKSSVSIGSSGHVVLVPFTGAQTLSSLSIAGAGSLDVGNNTVFINYTSDPKAAILGYLATGSNGGTWTGAGINSSVAAASGTHYGVAFADGADHVVSGLSSGQIELKYALYGDILLAGNVNGTDFAILAGDFGKSVTGGWEQGDLNYDGTVNGTDFSLLAENFGRSASGASIALPASEWSALDSFAASHGLLADLPEPSGVICTVMGLTVLARRRRAVGWV